MDIQRKAFEDWFACNSIHDHVYVRGERTDEKGNYYSEHAYLAWSAWQQAQKVTAPKPTKEVICAIENTVEDQLIASGITSDPFRLDGEKIYKAMIEAQEQVG